MHKGLLFLQFSVHFYTKSVYKKSQFLYLVMSLLVPIFFHSLYDYFLFLDSVPGIWVGGFVTLIVAFYIARNSIAEHLKASPYKKKDKK